MAFPAIVGSPVETSIVTAAATGSINLPTGTPGNLFVMLIRVTATVTITVTGFTELMTSNADASDDTTSIFIRAVDGTEGATVAADFSGVLVKVAAIVWEISGASDPATQAPQLSAISTGPTATEPDSLAVTPTGGAKDYLFGTFYTMEGEQTAIVLYPTNYTLGRAFQGTGISGAIGLNCTVGGAWRQLNSASDNPGVWDISGTTQNWSAWTIAVHPVAAVVAVLIAQERSIMRRVGGRVFGRVN
jgi:hypothetical protein